jgi:hypothetical protein
VLVLFTSISCDDFLNVNDDPNAATEAPGDFLFSEASAVLQSNRNIELGPTVSLWPQTFASNNSAGGLWLDAEQYNIGPSDLTITNNFGGIYTQVQNNLTLYIRDLEGNEPLRENAIAQARLVRDYTFWYLTVLFGDVPFSEANQPDIQYPAFDDQQDILDSLVVRIDNSIDMIEPADPDGDAITSADLFYSGDMEKWLRFANSLKLRILMLQYNTDPNVASEIENLIDNTNLIRDNADNFEFPYLEESGRENQQFQLHDDFAGGEPAFFYAGEELVDQMNADDDPRRELYFDEAPEYDDDFNQIGTLGYIGVPPGTGGNLEVSTLGTEITKPTFPGRILTASETLLYEAEFLAAEGDILPARDKLEAGIRASINDIYANTDSTITESEVDDYVNDILAKYDDPTVDNVEVIQIQQYIDSFEKVPENWTNWRRTKVPDLELPAQAALGSYIRRLPISAEEVAANPNAPEQQTPLDTPMSFEK